MRKMSLLAIGYGLLPVFLCYLVGAPAAEDIPEVTEFQLKAVYLNGYTQFITWPDSALPVEDSPYYICVMGEDPFERALEETVARSNLRKNAQGRLLATRYISVVEDAVNCHVLYISTSEASRIAAITEYLQFRPVLTVSDIKKFAVNGGMVQFYLRYSKVRFKINPRAIRNAGLKLDANLLRVGDVVQ